MNKSLRLTTLATAIALAMGSGAALAAAPAATQLPGQGTVVSGNALTTVGAISATGGQTLTQNGNTAIQWGVSSGADINAVTNATAGTTAEPGGFNIGSTANLQFDGTGAVLNIDVSGNPSQIMGALSNSGGNLFVANTNGIIVGGTASISASGDEVGLIGNTLGSTSGFATSGAVGATGVAYDGTGGDVTVMPLTSGSGINAASVLVSGGGTVNVDLSALTGGVVALEAGLPSDVTGLTDGALTTPSGAAVPVGFAQSGLGTLNSSASLAITGTLPGAATWSAFVSAGDASNAGTADLDGAATAWGGTFTNNGEFTWGGGVSGTTPGSVVNNGTMTLGGTPIIGGSLANNGQILGGTGHNIVAGSLNNAGTITASAVTTVDGGLVNLGNISATGTTIVGGGPSVLVQGGAFANSGTVTATNGVNVTGGDFGNTGKLTTNQVYVTNGSIVNGGQITGADDFETYSDATLASFTKGASYSITNTGTITSPDELWFEANDQYNQTKLAAGDETLNGSGGGFFNTGTLQVASGNGVTVLANNNIAFGGTVQIGSGATAKATSASNPLGWLDLEAGNYDFGSVFTSGGSVALTTDVTVGDAFQTWLAGNQVAVMGNLTSVDGTGNPGGDVDIIAGATPAADALDPYAVRVAAGKAITANSIQVDGDQAGDTPNVILQGTLAANNITLGSSVDLGTSNGVSDVFAGPAGGLQMWNNDPTGNGAAADDPTLSVNATGRVKVAPYLNDANFRFNGLPIDVVDGSTVGITIDADSQQGTPTSGYNLLVNSSVNLASTSSVDPTTAPYNGTGSAVTGIDTTPNSHLVLQSAGDIATVGAFYWPGYVYLGTVSADADGNALPGTLGLGQISLGGDFSNVLPGNVDGATGIHFITQLPLVFAADSTVTTNANAWINFGTDTLTQAYAQGTIGSGNANGTFYGGTQGPGKVINYGALAPANFVTQAPDANK